MKRVAKVPALAYALGVISVGAVFLGQAGWAALTSHAANERVFACVKRNGDVIPCAVRSNTTRSPVAASAAIATDAIIARG